MNPLQLHTMLLSLKNYCSILSIGVLLSMCFSCHSNEETTHPELGKITESVYASGFVKSKDQYQVFSKATGLIQKIWVHKGDHVKKGQVLFTLSAEVSKLNFDNAKLLASNADYKSNLDKLQELDLSIDLSKKKEANDKLLLDRQKNLWANQIGTRFELEQRELAYANSKSAREAAELRYQQLQKQLHFSSEQSKKNLSINESLLGDNDIRSAVDGTIYSITKEVGELVTPQIPLAIIGDSTNYTMLIQVDENDIVHIKTGQKLLITMDSYKDQLFEGVINKINPLMNERSRTFEVEAGFIQQPPTLYPNLTLEANIILQTKNNVLTIPRRYLLNGDSVMVSKKEKKKVVVGLKDYQKAEILEGLTKDDIIQMPN